MSAPARDRRRLTVLDIARMHADGVRIAMLTAYDYPTAALVDEAGIPLILVGDSLGQVILGYDTTVRVYDGGDAPPHEGRGPRHASGRWSWATCRSSPTRRPRTALANAGRFLREAGAQAVKVEGGVRGARIIEALVRAGIPVMGHIGLTPQAINALGRVRVQGKSREQARALLADALAVQEAGAFAVVAGARARAARGGDHRAPPHPDDRDRGGRGVLRPDPGHHRRARPRRLDARATHAVRGPAGDDPGRGARLPRRRRGGHVPGRRARRSGWTRPSSTRCSGARPTTGPTHADAQPLGGIPLDRDL